MLGAWEFSILGNVSMGIMAIAGVCSMVYAVGTSLTTATRMEEIQVDEQESTQVNKAA
jgi:hypothetical protein